MSLLTALCYAFFALRRLLTYLHVFQQEEYDSVRFVSWIVRRLAFDRRVTACLVLIGLGEFAGILPRLAVSLLSGAVFLGWAFFESDPRATGKKRLAMTPRAKRTLAVAAFIAAAVGLAAALSGSAWAWIVAVQLLPFTLAPASWLLAPYENKVQRRFWLEAHAKLEKLKPKIIGITGSYGKTSVKHILGHVLETHAPTLITPGSINTAMGIARVVREQLGPRHVFFVCEMGAYGPGSIRRLTELAAPNLAVITAVGYAHYERFKTLETVAQAKFELADAAVRGGGKVVVAEDVLKHPVPKEFASRHSESILAVGSSPACALRIDSVRQGKDGVEVDVIWAGAAYALRAPLFGEHHGLNIAISFAAACALGVDPAQVVIALSSVPQISHRLEVKRQPRGSIVIDDAYNSNPVGFANALRILGLLRQPGGRTLLATPGMVELGTAHDEEHARIGTLAARMVDVLLPVLPSRIPTLTAAYSAGNPQGTVIPCQNFAEAQAWLNANLGPADVLLIENDLPDLYEKKFSL